jgi:hypothetical protein
MKISDLCIRRPVFATVLSLAIMLVGLVSYTRLPVREYPKIDEPVVTVDTTYRGASAEIVESQISKPLEDSLAGIEGVDVITSISRQENSQISVRFKLERNPDSAASDVRDRVSRVRNKLADGHRRTGDRQGRGRRQSDHLDRVFLRPAFGAGSHRHRQSHRQAAPADAARRRRRARLRRAQVCDAHLARSRPSGGLQP